MERIYHHDGIVEVTNFIDDAECKSIVQILSSSLETWHEFCFYGAYGINPTDIVEDKTTSGISFEYLNSLRDKIMHEVEGIVGFRVQNVAASMHKWVAGSFAQPHSDNTDENGEPNSWRQYKYVAILYFNDDYDGGELYFTQHGISLKPQPGSLVVFEPSSDYIHGVHTIKSGDRFTLLTSWDLSGINYSDDFFEQKRVDVDAAYIESAKLRKEFTKEKI